MKAETQQAPSSKARVDTPALAQPILLQRLCTRFGQDCKGEWPAFDGTLRQYSPRLDLAVGPFAVGNLKLEAKYDDLTSRHRKYLELLWGLHVSNLEQQGEGTSAFSSASTQNPNARCFLAIEIENRGSRKHILGGMLNAAALGLFGIMIGWTDDSVRMLIRAHKYLRVLVDSRKRSLPVSNLLILSRAQVEQHL